MVTLKMSVNGQARNHPVKFTHVRYRFQRLDADIWTDVQTRYRMIGTIDSYVVPVGVSGSFRVGAALAFPDASQISNQETFSNAVDVNALLTPVAITLGALLG